MVRGNLFVRILFCIIPAYAIFIAGCGSSVPKLEDRYKSNDKQKSCKELAADITGIESAITERQQKIQEFEKELEAYRDWHNKLKVIFEMKHCSVTAVNQSENENQNGK
jgi:hypothetical protein